MPGEDLSILLYFHVPIQRESMCEDSCMSGFFCCFATAFGLVPSGGPPPGECTHTGEPQGVPEPQENPLVQEPPLQQKVGG